ncbi:hypothetical protein AALP_AA6G296600 [Arabis alpina]|uniref:ERCC4 domain-containing protein n=1 Tax=Arabis alpina TaxID=50452 RepID=A0A087GSK9_ARAAL|nr:hypothetical protein AALP_AA6G296600 [Arabis alpina]
MSDPIPISDDEDSPLFPSKKARKNPTISNLDTYPIPEKQSSSKSARKNPTILNLDIEQPPGSASTPLFVDELPLYDDVTVLKCGVSSRREDQFSGGKGVISLGSDSEDSPRPEISNKYDFLRADSLKQRYDLESGSSDADEDLSTRISKPSISWDNDTDWMQGASFPSSFPNDAIEVDSDQEKEVVSLGKRGRQKQTRSSKSTSPSVKALPKKHMSKEEKIRENKLRKEQEKLQKAALKAEEAKRAKLEKEKQKWENGKLALKSIVAEIDVKLVEGSVGGSLLSRLNEKGIKYSLISNPIEKSIVWTMSIPQEDLAQLSPQISYVLLMYEAEEFCNLVANERLLENISRVREKYPSYTVCYLTNKLMSYINKREREEYKNSGKSNGWRQPPIHEVLAKLTTHYVGVHSRHCVDEAEVAEHVVGLTSSLASCQFRKKSSWLSVNADNVLASMNSADKHLFKKSPWLKALVAIPKVQPRYAIAVCNKYPSMKSLLKVYMDPHISVHEKEALLKDLKVEVLLGGDIRLGEVCSKRIYRVLMSTCGEAQTDDV